MRGINRRAAVTSDMWVAASCGGYKVAMRGNIFLGLVWCRKAVKCFVAKMWHEGNFFSLPQPLRCNRRDTPPGSGALIALRAPRSPASPTILQLFFSVFTNPETEKKKSTS